MHGHHQGIRPASCVPSKVALTAELEHRGARHRHLRLIRSAVLARSLPAAAAEDLAEGVRGPQGKAAQERAGAEGGRASAEPPGFSDRQPSLLPVLNEWGEWAASPADLQPADSDCAAAAGGPGMVGVVAGNVAALVALYGCTGGVNWITRRG